MELFVDTSALVKFYYPERGSDQIEALLLAAERIFISRLSIIELASALARKQRNGEIDKAVEIRIWNAFEGDLRSDKMAAISLEDRIASRAAVLVRDLGAKEGLRSLDALQIASALSVPQAVFLSAVRRLTRIAALVGLMIHQPRTA